LRPPAFRRGDKLRVCPNILGEVLSPGDENRERDLVAKRDLYWRRGAEEYWILDADRREILRLTRGTSAWSEQRLSADEILTTPLLPPWNGVRVGELFP